MIDGKFKVQAAMGEGKVTLDVKNITFKLGDKDYRLSYSPDYGFYMLYEGNTEKPFRVGYLWGMGEDKDRNGPYIELMENVPDAPGDYGDAFCDYYRFYLKTGILKHWHEEP